MRYNIGTILFGILLLVGLIASAITLLFNYKKTDKKNKNKNEKK